MSVSTGNSRGFTLIELLVVTALLGLLATLGLLKYTDLRYNAKAAAVAGDLRAITVAAYNHLADNGNWAAETGAGVAPPELVPYLPAIQFDGPDYTLDWDNLGLGGTNFLVGVTVTTPDARFMSKLQRYLGSKSPFFVAGSSLTYIIVDASGNY